MFALSRLYRKALVVMASYPKLAYAQTRPWGPFLDGKSQYLFRTEMKVRVLAKLAHFVLVTDSFVTFSA